MNPEVSVIMSVYNGMDYLPQSVNSVLAQSFKNFEFLIVNDGSTDGTADFLDSLEDERIRVFHIENKGVAGAKNHALKNARGTWAAIIDHDDLWHPDKLKKQLDYLRQNPDTTLLGTFAEIIDKEGQHLYIKRKLTSNAELSKAMEIGNQFTHSTVMFPIKTALEIGGYYEKPRAYIVDYMLLYHLGKRGKMANLPEPLVKYRIVPGSLSSKNDPPRFHQIMHHVIRSGQISDEELSEIREMKKRDKGTKRKQMAGYHYYLGRVFLFYSPNRLKAIRHFFKAILAVPTFVKAWIYLVLCFMPRAIVRTFYKRYFGDSEQMDAK